MAKRRPKGTGSIFRRGRIWFVQYVSDSGRHRESSHSERREVAEKLLNKRLGEIAAGHYRDVSVEKTTIGDLIDLVVEDYRFRKLRSLDEVIWRADKNLRPLIGKLLAGRFGARDVKRYVEARRESGASDATINRELAIVRRGFTLGFQAEPQVVARQPYIPILDEDNTRQGFLEPEQYGKVLAELPERLKALFVCAYHVGTRKGELRRLRWEQVDFEPAQIRLTKAQTKGKRARTVPIYGDMETWLKSHFARRAPDCPWVFYYHGRPVGAQLAGWREACERAGMPGLLFHDLRRSAVRNMKRAGNPDKAVMEISGHKTRSIFDRYDIVSDADIASVAERTEEYLKARKEPANRLRRVK
jgi:integrase